MHIEKWLKSDVLVGIVLGATIGLYFPLEAYKTPLLVILAVVMAVKLKVFGTK